MGSKYHLKSNRQTSSAMAEAEEQYRAAGQTICREQMRIRLNANTKLRPRSAFTDFRDGED